ncbi:hypothetical protein ETD86_29415 [Nonomuraea turkmeniaca]|uniref:Uncharacterized protein n=1 Tax=Nonomuraea turkmeniaca TaxID=103838 RepID=A0A5S4FA45_9ACTN|nr:hypothetical protein [Nonomuraea turkmeniaca]TMR14067.1 hypothetical protein ETD86_29415 [Nonomuraea turkmeniaca]
MITHTTDSGTFDFSFDDTDTFFTISAMPGQQSIFLDMGDWGVTIHKVRLHRIKMLLQGQKPSLGYPDTAYLGKGHALVIVPDGDGMAMDLHKVYVHSPSDVKFTPVGCGVTIPTDSIATVIDAFDAALAASN